MSWNNYIDKTKSSKPRPLLVEALRYVTLREAALDLGCGAMNDSLFLSQNGFELIDAVDNNPSILDISKNLGDNSHINFHLSDILDFTFTKNKYNLVNAQFSLPFSSPNNFEGLWQNISESLNKGGIFSGQFFGIHDDWSHRSNMTFLLDTQVSNLFTNWNIISLDEFKGLRKTAKGEDKQWHIFSVIAIKN